MLRSGVIVTLAGTIGGSGTLGEGGPASLAKLNQPYGVAQDLTPALGGNGGVFICDSANQVIKYVWPNGTLTRIAGTLASPGRAGDGGPGTLGLLSLPYAIIPDPRGRGGAFWVEAGSHVLRFLAANGTLATVAGNGSAGWGGDGGPALLAVFNTPTGLAADGTSGDLLVADSLNCVVRRISYSTGLISTAAGVGAPGGLCSLPSSGDGGPASLARLRTPSGVASDGAGACALCVEFSRALTALT